MSEICGVYWIDGELRATVRTAPWLGRAEQGELNDEFCLPEMLPYVGLDGVIAMNWHGMGAEQGLDEGALASFLATMTGRADFALVDEFGERLLGVRVIDGKMTQHVVDVALGEEILSTPLTGDDPPDSEEIPPSSDCSD